MDVEWWACGILMVLELLFVKIESTFPHRGLLHGGVHACPSSLNGCCPGWQPRGASGACMSPVCSYECGSGVCVGPNICQCVDGSRSVTCPDLQQPHLPSGQGSELFPPYSESSFPYVSSDIDQISIPIIAADDAQSAFTCDSVSCEQECHMVHGIPQCACIQGFSINVDGVSCKDVDECQTFPGICQQTCRNTVGSFMCACSHGYTLSDNGRTCRRLHDYRHSKCKGRDGSKQKCTDRPSLPSSYCNGGSCSSRQPVLMKHNPHVVDQFQPILRKKALRQKVKSIFRPSNLPVKPKFPNQRPSYGPCRSGNCGSPVGNGILFTPGVSSVAFSPSLQPNSERNVAGVPNLPQSVTGNIAPFLPNQTVQPVDNNNEWASGINSFYPFIHQSIAKHEPNVFDSIPRPPPCGESGCRSVSEIEQDSTGFLPHYPQPCAGNLCPAVDVEGGNPHGSISSSFVSPCVGNDCLPSSGFNQGPQLPPNIFPPCDGLRCPPDHSFKNEQDALQPVLPPPCAKESCKQGTALPDGFTEWVNGFVEPNYQESHDGINDLSLMSVGGCSQTGCSSNPNSNYPDVLSNLRQITRHAFNYKNQRPPASTKFEYVTPAQRRIHRNQKSRQNSARKINPHFLKSQVRGRDFTASLISIRNRNNNERIKPESVRRVSQSSTRRSSIGVENLFDNRHVNRRSQQQSANTARMPTKPHGGVSSKKTITHQSHLNKIKSGTVNHQKRLLHHRQQQKLQSRSFRENYDHRHPEQRNKALQKRRQRANGRSNSAFRSRQPAGWKYSPPRRRQSPMTTPATTPDTINVVTPIRGDHRSHQKTKIRSEGRIKTKRLKSIAKQRFNKGQQRRAGRRKHASMAEKIVNFLHYFNKIKRKRGRLTQQEMKDIMQSDGVTCRDDLCTEFRNVLSEDEKIPQSFLCPPGFHLKTVNNVNYCEPAPDNVESRPGSDNEFHCPEGLIPVASNGGTTCVKLPPESDVVCPPGQKALKTPGGAICQYIDKHSEPTKSRICKPGQRLQPNRSGQRHTCIDDENSIIECSAGEEKIRTASGYECRQKLVVSKRTTEPPCPVGLMPVQTSVGRICQYVPRPAPKKPQCRWGQILVNTGTRFECQNPSTTTVTPPLTCPTGLILIDTADGSRCIVDPRLSPKSSFCPEGLVRVNGSGGMECQPKSKPCPLGQTSVHTDQGLICLYDDSRHAEGQDRLSGGCIDGEILTQLRVGFFCQPSHIDISEWMCPADDVLVQLPKDIACISREQTTITCMNGLELVPGEFGFTCIDPHLSHHLEQDQELLCSDEEILVQDDFGRRCVKISSNENLCGEGYKVVRSDRGMECKPLVMEIACPHGFYLVNTGGSPECLPVTGSNEPASPCLDDYHVTDTDNGRKCVLTDGHTPCPDDGSPSQEGCVRNLKALNLDCNPQCANGGSCQNGTCLCTKGVIGVACQEDVDECRLLSRGHCEYGCENTFGSYRCTCPAGRTLNSDGRTCKEILCIPECLNGGRCVNGRCDCTSGFEGLLCQDDVNECTRFKHLCQHHCRNTYGSYACVCRPGSRLQPDGRTCLNTTCTPECKNNGVCHGNRCRCRPGYEGIICQIDVNECFPNPCSHHCSNIPGSYQCACPRGFALGPDKHNCRKLSG